MNSFIVMFYVVDGNVGGVGVGVFFIVFFLSSFLFLFITKLKNEFHTF